MTLESEAELQTTQSAIKEMTEPVLNHLHLTKVEHLFVPLKTEDKSGQLKLFIEEHPDIIFDFVVVSLILSAWKVRKDRRT